MSLGLNNFLSHDKILSTMTEEAPTHESMPINPTRAKQLAENIAGITSRIQAASKGRDVGAPTRGENRVHLSFSICPNQTAPPSLSYTYPQIQTI